MKVNGRRFRAVLAAARSRVLSRLARPEQPAPAVLGVVEEFTHDLARGWVHVELGAAPVRITLRLNNREIAGTWATRPPSGPRRRTAWGETREFELRLRDVWTYAPKASRLTVRADGAVLPLAGFGVFRRSDGERAEKTPEDLQWLLKRGRVFSPEGRLQLSKQLDTTWQGRVMELYDLVREQVRSELGHDVFLVYGSLLGVVRDGGYIGHDTDFDCAYVSGHTDPAAAAAELHRLALALAAHGLRAQAFWSSLHIYHPEHPGTRIDLFHLYWDAEGRLQFPFGVAGTTRYERAHWQGVRAVEFTGGHGLVPVDGERLVEHIYGAGWRIPNPGFDWERDRTTRGAHASLLTLRQREDVYWASLYAQTAFAEPSPFCRWLLQRADLPPAVLDLGCGDGRDSVAFAGAERRVTGVDACALAIEHARARDGAAEVRFVATDFEGEEFAALLAETARGPAVLHYLRFTLHAILEATQDGLLTALAAAARPGDFLAAEFRTPGDETLSKAHGKHYRRFQDGSAVVDRLRAEGWTIVAEQSGTGLSPYSVGDSERREDPQLYRVVARRDPARPAS